ncbi:hypothetical protein B0T21DRAFT_389842 [Apiosordaria backusii]|uniref:Rhodopsin domain-containing protein n=1 Tax=Apiosordaria backusii TaxID=314023 RepID=A0AA40ESC1_9PEZI|nr:hypothetical protein B0T21DRAFT_389842 [Apiosordaria backusii]
MDSQLSNPPPLIPFSKSDSAGNTTAVLVTSVVPQYSCWLFFRGLLPWFYAIEAYGLWLADIPLEGQLGLSERDLERVTLYLQVSYVVAILYFTVSGTAKLGILLMYRRIFQRDSAFNLQLMVVGTLVFLWWLSGTVATVFNCIPVEKAWALPAVDERYCYNYNIFWLATGSLEIVLDVMILALPMASLRKLKMPKVSAGGIFFLGGCSTIHKVQKQRRHYRVGLFHCALSPPDVTHICFNITINRQNSGDAESGIRHGRRCKIIITMDTTNTKRFFDNRIIRTFLGFHNFLILASSTILTGLLSYLLHRYRYRNTHLVYQEVIAVLTLFLYLFATFLPAFKFYRGYMLPLNLVLSYLWLTSLIFSSQDYSGNRCFYNSPPFVSRCRLKHTIQAFWIIGFSYLFLNSILEALMWAGTRTNRLLHGGDAEKDRPLTGGNAVPVSNGTGATTTV